MKTIAIIDDDPYISDLLAEILAGAGYRTLRAYSGTEAVLLLGSQRPDLGLLDLMLPGLSGEEVLPGLRGIPVIVLSARADSQSKVSLLLSGAADYVTKPFDTQELLARIAVQLRKAQPVSTEVLSVGPVTMHVATRQVQVDGAEIRMTRTEYAILKLLLQNPNQVVTKSQILDHISLDTPDCTETSLKQHMSNLRRKLRQAGQERIEAVWGIGFRMVE